MKGSFWPRPHSSPQGSCCRCSAILQTPLLRAGDSSSCGESTPIGKRAQLTSILRMMSNLGPRAWSSDLCRGPLGHGGGVCTCAFTCMGQRHQESGFPADLDRTVKESLSNWTRKRNAIYCEPKLMQQDLWFHPNMQNANRKRNSRCYKNTCHEQASAPDALQILPLIFTVTLKPEYYYL